MAPPGEGTAGRADLRVRSFLPDVPLCRARRPTPLAAVVENLGDEAAIATARLSLPLGVRVMGELAASARIEEGGTARFVWHLEAEGPRHARVLLEVAVGDAVAAKASVDVMFLPEVKARRLPYIPEPQPAKASLLIGAHHCPLWEADRPHMWANILKHPERTPALGFYSQENPEVSDWETKWAVEHGVSFFVYCWYRASQGEPVKMRFGSAIHDALFKSRFLDKIKFAIMWENQSRGRAGVADEADLMNNLLPFWMENYFKHPSYLKVDNRPLLFIYRPEFLVQDLRGEANVARALDKMRQACREAGFDGLYVLGEYRGLDPNHLKLMKRLGLDYTFAYCWHVQNNPTPAQAIAAQMNYIRRTQELAILPQVVTVSQGWSGWRDEGSIWTIPPAGYETLLRKAKDFVATLPANELGSRMILLDNWNEWGEGHYIAPYREYGFGYLDAVRKVFTDAPEPHEDLIPEDIGLGPYDTAYKTHLRREEEQREKARQKAQQAGISTGGLVAWWAFDEEADSPTALDSSGNGLAGTLRNASRAPGLDGSALACNGGCAVVPNNPLLSPPAALTIECWVKTDLAGQTDKWFLNRIHGGDVSSGYRMGLSGSRPAFGLPLTPWSHHLVASEPLPIGRWVHLAGTFDGKVMRLYVDGVEGGMLERTGPLRPNAFNLILGNYDVGHKAHFTGLLDEVRLYRRALSPEEVRANHRAAGLDARGAGRR